MNDAVPRILLIGYGNPGRLDDGLGPALAEAMQTLALPGVTVESNYQLTVEDAAAVTGHDAVIFADADVQCAEPFHFRPIESRDHEGFSTHSVEPEAVLGLAQRLFDAQVNGYVLGIRGYKFNEFGERLSPGARANLTAAIDFLVGLLRKRSLKSLGEAARPQAKTKVQVRNA